jgi:hydroxylamine reductase
MLEGLFATVTNVDFDPDHLTSVIKKCGQMKEKARDLFLKAGGKEEGNTLFDRIKAFFGVEGDNKGPMAWTPATNPVAQGEKVGIETLHTDEDIRSAIEILIYGLKGMAAYADHAQILGKIDEEAMAFNHKALAATCDPELGLMDFVNLCMECGKHNLTVMGLLNQGHVENYGHPVPTPVNTGTKAGKGILVSGHDLKMLEELLKQTEGKGINIYTHGEMLPAHGYPGLKKYAHLAGNFGGAWQDQAKELPNFSGAIIFNTNCIQKPSESYKDRLFTWGCVAWPGITHIDGFDFSKVID